MAQATEDYFCILALVARSDGKVHAEEAAAVSQAADIWGLAPEARHNLNRLLDPNSSVDMQAEVAALTSRASPELLAEALRDGYLVAAADGHVSPIEVAVLDALLEQSGYDSQRRIALHEWARGAASLHRKGLELLSQS